MVLPGDMIVVALLCLCGAIVLPAMLENYTPDKTGYINNYNNCKKSQIDQENQNEQIKITCSKISTFNEELCNELYERRINNNQYNGIDCDRACNSHSSPTMYEKCSRECFELFNSYRTIYCISETEFQQCIENYNTCRWRMLGEQIMLFITIVFGIPFILFALFNSNL